MIITYRDNVYIYVHFHMDKARFGELFPKVTEHPDLVLGEQYLINAADLC